MAAPANELQAAVVTALKADAAVTALVSGAIFDEVPEASKNTYPRITIGPSDEVPANADCIASAFITVASIPM